jgi:hypothetical protein
VSHQPKPHEDLDPHVNAVAFEGKKTSTGATDAPTARRASCFCAKTVTGELTRLTTRQPLCSTLISYRGYSLKCAEICSRTFQVGRLPAMGRCRRHGACVPSQPHQPCRIYTTFGEQVVRVGHELNRAQKKNVSLVFVFEIASPHQKNQTT